MNRKTHTLMKIWRNVYGIKKVP